jgi:four helix bundle protein
MPPIHTHEDIIAWQLCEELADLIIDITSTGRVTKDLELCDQIRRSSGAPGPHIAEGFGRYKPREFAHYLRLAVGSLMETDTWLQRGNRHNYWTPGTFKRASRLLFRALDMTRKLLASKVRQIAAEEHQKAARRAQRETASSRRKPTRVP